MIALDHEKEGTAQEVVLVDFLLHGYTMLHDEPFTVQNKFIESSTNISHMQSSRMKKDTAVRIFAFISPMVDSRHT